jgi:hypothetical protein
MKPEPTFYAVIPAVVRYDKRLKHGSRLLYGEITALCNKKGYCWATNAYFAELYDVHTDTVSEWVRELVAAGHISTTQLRHDRRIHLSGSAKMPRRVGENTEQNNTTNTVVSKDTTAWSFKGKLAEWDGGSRPSQIIAWFVKKKGLTFDNSEQMNKCYRDQIKAARKIADLGYVDNQIVDAGERSAKITDEWTLFTVLKLIR